MHVLTASDGEATIDNRGSPGLTVEHARALGLDGVSLGEGTCVSFPTLGCIHCGSVVVINPNRVRERAYCRPCNHYICDCCDKERRMSDYLHHTIADVIEAIKKGSVYGR
jgi:hypothetical protein